MKRIILSVMASIAMIIGLAAGFAPVANAAPTVPVGPGTGLSGTPGVTLSPGACSFGALGYDNAGRLVGLTAGHCKIKPGYQNGDPVYKSTTGDLIGHWTNVASWSGTNPPSPTLDYAVIELDPNVVIPLKTAENGSITVSSFGAAALWNNVCKNGIGTGQTCGLVNGTSTPNNAFTSWASSNAGDSGGGTVLAGTSTMVGYVLGGNAAVPTNFIYQKIQPVLTAINAIGAEGAGFTPVP